MTNIPQNDKSRPVVICFPLAFFIPDNVSDKTTTVVHVVWMLTKQQTPRTLHLPEYTTCLYVEQDKQLHSPMILSKPWCIPCCLETGVQGNPHCTDQKVTDVPNFIYNSVLVVPLEAHSLHFCPYQMLTVMFVCMKRSFHQTAGTNQTLLPRAQNPLGL